MTSKFSLDAFQEACAARDPLGFDVIGSGLWQSKRVKLDQPFALVGSHDQAHVRWQDTELSLRHAYFQVDLASRTGIFVNGTKTQAARLDLDDELQVGPFSIHIRE